MAKQTLSIVSNFQPQNLDREIADQTSRLAPLLARIKIVQGGGINCAWVNQFSNKSFYIPTTDGYAIQAAEYDSDTKVISTLNWFAGRQSFELTSTAQETSASTMSGASALKNLFQHELKGACAVIGAKMNLGLSVGTGASRTLTGLTSAIIASGTYAGVDVGTYTEFAGVVDANGGTPRALTAALMSTTLKNIRVKNGTTPKLIRMHPDMLNKYVSLFTSIRVVNDSSSPFDLSVDPKALCFQGIPVLEDRDCANTEVQFLDPDSMELQVVPPMYDPMTSVVVRLTSATNNGASTGFPVICQSVANDGPSDKWFVRTPECQLVVKYPGRNGRLTDLSLA
jgi:hypothetical protein